MKLHVYMRKLKFWTHLENLPDNSIAKQCLHLSAQLAEHKKPSFIFSLREILQQYGCMNQNQDQFIGTTMDYNGQKIKNYLPKIKQTIMTSLKNHQHNAIRSNRKLQFYSIFKTDQRSSLQLELIKCLSMIKPGRTRQEVIILKSPIWLKLGRKIECQQHIHVSKHLIKIFHFTRVMGKT